MKRFLLFFTALLTCVWVSADDTEGSSIAVTSADEGTSVTIAIPSGVSFSKTEGSTTTANITEDNKTTIKAAQTVTVTGDMSCADFAQLISILKDSEKLTLLDLSGVQMTEVMTIDSNGNPNYLTGAWQSTLKENVETLKLPKLAASTSEESSTTSRKIPDAQNYISFCTWFQNVKTLYIAEGTTELGKQSLYICKKMTDVYFPASMETIGESALSNLQDVGLTVHLNDGLKYIEKEAFSLTKIKKTTVQKYDDEGNKKGEEIDHGDYTITLGSSLKRIETSGLSYQNYKGEGCITDVYVLAEEAPVCAMDAFPSQSYCGNNGHSPSHTSDKPYSRDCYPQFTMLHFPATCTTEQAAKYTDVNKKYSILDETLALDGKGDVKKWPSQMEYNRIFCQAVAGYTWNQFKNGDIVPNYDGNSTAGWTYTMDTGINYHGTVDAAGYYSGYSETISDNLSDGVTESDRYSADYIGWHQFVLSEYYNYEYEEEHKGDDEEEKEKPVWNFAKYKTNDWYAVCFPFDLTRSDLLRIFGCAPEVGKTVTLDGKTVTEACYPIVRTLYGVDHDYANKHVMIRFTEDLCNKKNDDGKYVVWNYDEYDEQNGELTYTTEGTQPTGCLVEASSQDDPVIMQAGCPYIIKPQLPDDVISALNVTGTAAVTRMLSYTEPVYDDNFSVKKDSIKGTASTVRFLKLRTNYHVNAIENEEGKASEWKENVICGHLVPAGTGLQRWQKLIVGSKEVYERIQANKKNVLDLGH